MFRKSQNMEGPMTPKNLEPGNHQIIKIIKIIKNREHQLFFQHGKDAHRKAAKVGLNNSCRSLIWNFWEQIIFLQKYETCNVFSELIT